MAWNEKNNLRQSLTVYTLTKECIFSIQFLKRWQAKFVSESRVCVVGDHVIYSRDFVFDSGVILQAGKLDASHS